MTDYTSPPTTAVGKPGDVKGMTSFSNTYFYYCVSDYRPSWTSSTLTIEVLSQLSGYGITWIWVDKTAFDNAYEASGHGVGNIIDNFYTYRNDWTIYGGPNQLGSMTILDIVALPQHYVISLNGNYTFIQPPRPGVNILYTMSCPSFDYVNWYRIVTPWQGSPTPGDYHW